jgi:hypothetical protein
VTHGPRSKYFTVAIRNYDDSGSTTTIRAPLGGLAPLFDRLGRHEAAATVAGFAIVSPMTATARSPKSTP